MIAGVTGHQALGDEEGVQWVREQILRVIVAYQVKSGLTSLAAGTDQLFANVMASMRLPYVAVLPCDDYEKTFTSDAARAEYRRLLQSAGGIHKIGYSSPSERAFMDAGKWIVHHSDMMIAVWDGEQARGLGGTGDVVAAARKEARRLILIDPIRRTVNRPPLE